MVNGAYVLVRKSEGWILGIYTSAEKAESARALVPHLIHWDTTIEFWYFDKPPETGL